jgi:hypothetical protein
MEKLFERIEPLLNGQESAEGTSAPLSRKKISIYNGADATSTRLTRQRTIIRQKTTSSDGVEVTIAPPSRRGSIETQMPWGPQTGDTGSLQELGARLDMMEKLLFERGERSSTNHFLIGLLVGALLMVVPLTVLFVLYSTDSGQLGSFFVAGTVLGIAVTAAVGLTACACKPQGAGHVTQNRSAKKPADQTPAAQGGDPSQLILRF